MVQIENVEYFPSATSAHKAKTRKRVCENERAAEEEKNSDKTLAKWKISAMIFYSEN